MLPSGMISLEAKPYEGTENAKFKRSWFSQPSTARMATNESRLNCSDTVDATGRYIWRENGKRNGLCYGLDFQQAARRRRAGTCVGEISCLSTEATIFVTYAYDAAMTVAHALDRLLNKSIDPYSASAKEFATAMQESTFRGASGEVSFEENGDRRAHESEHTVYNYRPNSSNFLTVGSMAADGGFKACARCPDIMFSSGSTSVPNVQRGVSDAQALAFFFCIPPLVCAAVI